ncbi:MAG: glycosyltransferase [Anaerolineae bacterium]|nr:glycosyltransferase [Anaerolineae bacterium]
MRILFVVPYTPNLIRVRPYNLIRGLAARGHAVTVATLWSPLEEQADLQALQKEGVKVIAAPLPRWRSLWNCLRALPTRVPLQAVYCWQPALARLLQSAIHNSQFDIVHVEHLRGVCYGLYLKSQITGRKFQLPIVWDSVDCISHLFEQAAARSSSLFGRWATRLELGRTRRYEGWLVDQFDRTLITSPIDRQALFDLASRLTPHASRITVLSNGVDLSYFTPADEPRRPDTLVFTGKMSYHANITAVLYLLEEIMPHVWAQRPEVKVWIVGKNPSREVQRLAAGRGPRVTVTGTVADVRPYLQRAAVAVAPIAYGVGIQNKVLEAMACGVPVVATPQAVAALDVVDGEHVLVADGPALFATAVLRLLSDTDLSVSLGETGRRYVERYHDWRSIVACLEETYAQTIAR